MVIENVMEDYMEMIRLLDLLVSNTARLLGIMEFRLKYIYLKRKV